MTGHLSNSQIGLYSQCSLKYKFQYVDELPKRFKPSGLAFGSAIHSALAWYHKQMMNGNGVDLSRLHKIFDADWYSLKAEKEIRYKDGEEEMKLTVLGKELLSLYFDLPRKKIKGAEVPFTVPLLNPSNGKTLGIDLEGIIDLVEGDDTITEFKTSAQMMDSQDLENHLQLTIYSYAFERITRKPPKSLKVVDFVKSKKPKMMTLETKRGKDDYERLFFLAGEVLKGIRERVFFPRTGFWCKDCEYAENCKVWKGD
jgi:CRISPR/Cas system-associated exonuclease Cas4 (RecB family)